MKCLICLNLLYAISRLSSPIHCFNHYEVTKKIIERSKSFDYLFVVNDRHGINDKEFDILPKHCTTDIECSRLDMNFGHKANWFDKKELDVFKSSHINLLLKNLNIDDIYLCGFVGCLDILESAKNRKVSVFKDSVGDLNMATLCNTMYELEKNGTVLI